MTSQNSPTGRSTDPNIVDARISEKAETFIQWKGTEVCMDIWCECGAELHIDALSAYAFRCPSCNKTFLLGTRVTVAEAPPGHPQEEFALRPELDEGAGS